MLRDLTLTIRKGEVVALTGPSGGGKSTLLHLLAGFIAPDAGQIHLFGEAPGSFRFGWLGQKGFLVHGTWADNLRLTTPDASDIAIETAMRNVGLGSLLDSRQQGIYSPVSMNPLPAWTATVKCLCWRPCINWRWPAKP